jgi:hypothetical protein
MLIKMSCFLPLQALWGAAYYSLEEPLYVTQVTYTWLLNHKCKHLVNWVPKTGTFNPCAQKVVRQVQPPTHQTLTTPTFPCCRSMSWSWGRIAWTACSLASWT